MNSKNILSAAIIAALGLTLNTGVLAAADHDGHDKTPAEAGAKMESAKTFPEAMKEIDEHYEAIAKLIESGKLDAVHTEAEHIQHHALTLGKLAMAADSGIAKDKVKDINLTGKELAGKFDAIDAAADAGKKDETKKVYDEMGKLIEKLKSLGKVAK